MKLLESRCVDNLPQDEIDKFKNCTKLYQTNNEVLKHSFKRIDKSNLIFPVKATDSLGYVSK